MLAVGKGHLSTTKGAQSSILCNTTWHSNQATVNSAVKRSISEVVKWDRVDSTAVFAKAHLLHSALQCLSGIH